MQDEPELEPQSSYRKPILIMGGVIVAFIVLIVVGVMMSSTSEDSTGDPGPTSVNDADVFISVRDYAYNPKVISIPRGAKVTWLNDDKVDHTATDKNGRWDSTVIHNEQEQSVTLTASGTYQYYCTIHPYMTGTITVRTDLAPTPAPSFDATATPTHN
ncbi:MAG: cupredoxin domain-containing protein [Chloroflexota bacterium]